MVVEVVEVPWKSRATNVIVLIESSAECSNFIKGPEIETPFYNFVRLLSLVYRRI